MSISILWTLSLEHWLNPITACLTRVAVGLPILPTHRLPQCDAHTVSTGALPITLYGGGATTTGCITLVGVCLPISSTHRLPHCEAHTVITGALPITLCGGPSTGCNTLAGVCLPISSTYRGVYLLAYTPRDSCGGVDRAGTS